MFSRPSRSPPTRSHGQGGGRRRVLPRAARAGYCLLGRENAALTHQARPGDRIRLSHDAQLVLRSEAATA